MCSVENFSDVEIWIDRRTGTPEPRDLGRGGPPITWAWAGELDAADVEDLWATWRSILVQEPRHVVIDMAAVTFLDCRILSFLVEARRGPSALFLRSVSPWGGRLLTLAGLDDLMTPQEPGADGDAPLQRTRADQMSP